MRQSHASRLTHPLGFVVNTDHLAEMTTQGTGTLANLWNVVDALPGSK